MRKLFQLYLQYNSIDSDEAQQKYYEYLKNQVIDLLIYDQYQDELHKSFTDKIIKQWKNGYFISSLSNKMRTNGIFNIIKDFDSNVIEYILLKGPTISRHYNNNDARIFADIDILVNNTQIESSRLVLNKHGYYEDKNKTYYHDLHFEKQGMIPIELHHLVSPKSYFENVEWLTNELLRTRIKTSIKDIDVYVADDNYNLAYLLLHAIMHLSSNGFGLRHLMDIHVTLMNTKIDWIKLEKILKCMKIDEISSYILSITSEIFETEVKSTFMVGEDDKYNLLKDYLFKDAVIMDNPNSDNYFNNCYVRYTRDTDMSRIKLFILLLFPAKETLPDRYRYATSNKYLLPIAWMHRLGFELIHQRKRMLHMLSFKPNSEYISRQVNIINAFNLGRR